jgi:hypothetical protein
VNLTGSEVIALRLSALLLVGDAEQQPTTVAGIVERFGAMQAQDLGSGLWSFGVRMPRPTEADVTDALERRGAADPSGVHRHSRRGGHPGIGPVRLPPAVVRESTRCRLHRTERRYRADLRPSRGLGA